MSIDDKIDGSSKFERFFKSALYTLSAFVLLNSAVLKDAIAQSDPVQRNLTVQVQLFKSDSSLFNHEEAWLNIWGNDVNNPDGSIVYGVDPVDSSGYVEFNFDLWTPAPNGVGDYVSSVPEGFRMSAFPNPYNPSTNLVFEVPKSGSYDVNLYNILGEELAGWSAPKYLSEGEYIVKLGGGVAGIQFARVTGDDFSKLWKLVNEGGASTAYVDEKFGNSNYFGSTTSSLPKGNSLEGINDEIISDSISIQWVVPGFGIGNQFHSLFDGNEEFRDTIYQEFYLPYPSDGPGMKFDLENKSTMNVDRSYFQTGSGFNFEYKSDAKKD